MSLFGNYNYARAAADSQYAWDTAATQGVIQELEAVNVNLKRIHALLAGDFEQILLALYQLLDTRLGEDPQ